MSVTARFYVNEMTYRGKGPYANATVILTPAYANGANAEWASATPSGRIELSVGNPEAIKQFEEWRVEGQDLHITFEPKG